MPEYNLGTASGRIVIDGSAAELGFKVAQTAAGAFFDVVRDRIADVQQLGRRLAIVGAGGVAGFGLAVKSASAFEEQMSGVRAVVGGTEQDFEALRQTALRLGADTSFSATEAALALEELAKAGIPIKDIINGAADATVALAAAGGVSLQEAAEISANAMNQFGIAAEDMNKVADIFAGVANTSAADVSSLGQSLSQAGAIANLAGLSFRDTAIALGEMADAGINGSDAGTSLKTMLNNLIPSTDKQIQRFKELGLLTFSAQKSMEALRENGIKPLGTSQEILQKQLNRLGAQLSNSEVGSAKQIKATQKLALETGALSNQFFDAKGNVKDLGGLQKALGDSLQGMTRQQKLANLEILFGADAMRASAILSLAGEKGYQRFSKAVGETTAAEVAAERLNNLAGATEALKGSLETARIVIGSIFLPVLTAIVKAVTFVVNAFNSLPKGIQVAIGVLTLIASTGALVVGALLAMLPVIISMVANFLLLRVLRTVIGSFQIFYATLRGGMGIMAAQSAMFGRLGIAAQVAGKRVMLFSRILMALRAAVLFMLGPWGLVIAAVVAFIALGVLLYNKWAPFRNLVDSIASALREKFLSAWESIQPVINSAVGMFQKFVGFIQSTLLPVLESIGKMLLGKLLSGWSEVSQQVMGVLMPAIQQLAAAFTGEVIPAAQKLWTFLQPLLAAFGKFAMVVGGVLLGAFMLFGKIMLTVVLPALAKVVGFLLGVVIDAIVDLVTGIIQAVTGIIQIFTGLINFITGVFTGDWSKAWEGVKTVLQGILNLIIGAVKIAFSIGLLKAVGLGFRAVIALVRGSWSLVLAVFRGSAKFLWGIVRGAFTLIVRGVQGYFRLWVAVVRGGFNLIRAIFTGVLNFIRGLVLRILRGIVSLFRGGLDDAGGATARGLGRIKDFFSNALDAVVNFVRGGIERVIAFFASLPGRIRSALGDLIGTMTQIGRDIIQGMINGVTDMASSLVSKVSDVIGGAKAAAKSLLGIGSPSKEFKAYGEWTVEGLEIGIDKRAISLYKTAAMMAQSVIDGYASAMSGVQPQLMAPLEVASVPVVKQQENTASKKPSGKKAMSTSLRMVEGELKIDRSGRAYIKGLALEALDEESGFEDTHEGMGGKKR